MLRSLVGSEMCIRDSACTGCSDVLLQLCLCDREAQSVDASVWCVYDARAARCTVDLQCFRRHRRLGELATAAPRRHLQCQRCPPSLALFTSLLSTHCLPTALARQLMQSPPSVCPFPFPFLRNRLTVVLGLLHFGHDHSSQGIEDSRSRSWGGLMQSVRLRSRAFFLVLCINIFDLI